MFESTHQISISWWGERLVSINGFEESVTINEFASKYLRSAPFDGEASLQDRLDCDSLWERVDQLYIESDTILSSTWIYKYLVALIEFRPYCRCCSGDPQAIIRSEIPLKRRALFGFTFDQYKEHWGEPGEEVAKFYILARGEDSMRYLGRKEIIEAALAKG